jgi:hypothetical protein
MTTDNCQSTPQAEQITAPEAPAASGVLSGSGGPPVMIIYFTTFSCQGTAFLLTKNLDYQPFAPLAVKLGIENLLPGAEIQLPICHRYNNLMVKKNAFQMGITIALPCSVMFIVIPVGSQLFRPFHHILFDTILFIIDVNTGGDMHCTYENHPLVDTGLFDRLGNKVGDVNEFLFLPGMKPVVFGMPLHEDFTS